MENDYASSLLRFLDNSPCNFFAVDTIRRELENNGFSELNF